MPTLRLISIPSLLLDSILDQYSYYEFIPMYSTDDGHTGYPEDVSSLSSGSLLDGPWASHAYPSPIVKWLVPPRPPCTHGMWGKTSQVAKEVWEEVTSTKHYVAQ